MIEPTVDTTELLVACRSLLASAKAVAYGPAVTTYERNNLKHSIRSLEQAMYPNQIEAVCVHPFEQRKHGEATLMQDGQREWVLYTCGVCGVTTNAIYPAGWDAK